MNGSLSLQGNTIGRAKFLKNRTPADFSAGACYFAVPRFRMPRLVGRLRAFDRALPHPRHHSTQPRADHLDGMLLTLLEQCLVFLVAVLIFLDPFAGERKITSSALSRQQLWFAK